MIGSGMPRSQSNAPLPKPMSYGPTYGGRMNYGGCSDNGGYLDGWCGDGGGYGFGPNNRPGLVGGDDSGT